MLWIHFIHTWLIMFHIYSIYRFMMLIPIDIHQLVCITIRYFTNQVWSFQIRRSFLKIRVFRTTWKDYFPYQVPSFFKEEKEIRQFH